MKKVLLISLVVALAGCKTTLMDDDRLRLYVVDCGELEISDVSLFSVSNDETDVRKQPPQTIDTVGTSISS